MGGETVGEGGGEAGGRLARLGVGEGYSGEGFEVGDGPCEAGDVVGVGGGDGVCSVT